MKFSFHHPHRAPKGHKIFRMSADYRDGDKVWDSFFGKWIDARASTIKIHKRFDEKFYAILRKTK